MPIIPVLFITVALLGGAGRPAENHHQMADPLFGISYDPQLVRFEKAPELIGKMCPDLHGRELWVYARFKNPEAEYFILSGFRKIYPDSPHAQPAGTEPDFGIAVSISGKKCTEDQSEYFMRQEINPARGATPIRASASVLQAISADALERYARAFGGKRKFLDKLSPGDRQDAPPILQKQLEVFENSTKTAPR